MTVSGVYMKWPFPYLHGGTARIGRRVERPDVIQTDRRRILLSGSPLPLFLPVMKGFQYKTAGKLRVGR